MFDISRFCIGRNQKLCVQSTRFTKEVYWPPPSYPPSLDFSLRYNIEPRSSAVVSDKSLRKRGWHISKKRGIYPLLLSLSCAIHHCTTRPYNALSLILTLHALEYGAMGTVGRSPFLPIDYQPLYFHVSFIFCRWLFEGGGGDVIYINLSFFRSLLSWSCISNSIEIKKDIKNNN